jgi:prepilin-type N-terminal cleavage/methylation domain-containing protein
MRSPLNKAFTLIELMVVVVILGVVAGFAIPNYTKSVERSHRKDAESNLRMIHAAQQMYAARNNDAYWTGGNVGTINSNLQLHIVPNGKTYSCTGGGATFSCTAVRGAWTVTVTQASTTPTCAPSGSCP